MTPNAITIKMGDMVITIPLPGTGQSSDPMDLSNFYTKAEVDQIASGLAKQIGEKVGYEPTQTNATNNETA